MKNGRLVRTITYACAAIVLVGCKSSETLAPSGPRRMIPPCEDPTCEPPPPAGVIGRFGLNIHSNVLNGETGATPELDALSDLHVNLVRMDVDWGHERIQPTWAPLQFQLLHDRGIDILAGIGYRYSFESPGTGGDFAPCALSPQQMACVPTGAAWDTFYQEWVTYVNQLVANNHQYVKYWATWNEPNEKFFFTGRPSQYDSLAAALCNAVWTTRQATGNPELYCVGPDLAVHRPFQDGAGTEWNWLQSRMNNVNFDIISIHWYEWLADVKAKTNYVKSLFPGKSVWVTETGMPDPTYRFTAADPEFQEEDLVAKWQDLHSGLGPMDALFYFDLQSVENGITQDFNPRPAYYALKRLNEGSYVDPIPGNCSTATGNELCAYTSWIPPQHGCRTDYYVRNRFGQPVQGATILAKVRVPAPYYPRVADLGYRTTNAAGVASFTAHCGWLQSAHFVSGGSLTSAADSPEMYVDESNRLAVHTFNVW